MVNPKNVPAAQRSKLAAELEQVRKRRYATSHGETIAGASALALPIIGPNNDVRAAVNVTGPAGRWTKQAMLKNLDELLQEVDSISALLGHRST
jgi:DNA-binding IclR family transcriptional regulator